MYSSDILFAISEYINDYVDLYNFLNIHPNLLKYFPYEYNVNAFNYACQYGLNNIVLYFLKKNGLARIINAGFLISAENHQWNTMKLFLNDPRVKISQNNNKAFKIVFNNNTEIAMILAQHKRLEKITNFSNMITNNMFTPTHFSRFSFHSNPNKYIDCELSKVIPPSRCKIMMELVNRKKVNVQECLGTSLECLGLWNISGKPEVLKLLRLLINHPDLDK